jgi:PAS domain S-box-containing protein
MRRTTSSPLIKKNRRPSGSAPKRSPGLDRGVFQSIVESGQEGILIFDQAYRIEYANRRASEITGTSHADLLRQTVHSLPGLPDQSLLQDLFAHPERYREGRCMEVHLPVPGDQEKEVEVCLGLAEGGRRTQKGVALLRSIAASKQMERRIEEATQQFEKIAEMGEDGVFVFDHEFRILFANQMAAEITGIPKKELIGKNFFTVIGKQDKEFLEGTVIRGEGVGEKLCMEMSIVTPRGHSKETEVCIASSKSENGQLKTYAYIRDITVRKRCERDLKDSEEKLRRLFERVRHGLFFSSKEGKFLDCNQAMIDMLGYPSKEELLDIDLGRNLYVHPEDRLRFQETMERDGFVKDYEVEFRKKNGEKITVLLTSYPLANEKGEIAGYEGINLDISERKRIEEERREANEFFRNLIESSVDGIIATDMKGGVFIFNKGAEGITGYTAEEVVGKIPIEEFYPEGMAKEVMKKLRGPEHGGVGKLTPIQLTVLNKAKEAIPIQLSAALVYDRNGREGASVGIFTDLRPRLNMERKLQETHLQLVSSEKMASLGKLAAGIAHEINNPLGGILIYSSLLMEDLPEADPRRQDLARIVQETGRCKEIVKSLLEFARQSEPRMEPVDVNRAITDGLFFLENQALFLNIRISKRLDPSLPKAFGNAGQLKQVFMNIIINAAEAMHGNGELTIHTSASPDRKTVFMEFSDTGEGIPEENLSRIFEPFFTTKDIGKGTGLGLATSYGIIESHGGRIGVKSRVGEGATFTIELPVHPEENVTPEISPRVEPRL